MSQTRRNTYGGYMCAAGDCARAVLVWRGVSRGHAYPRCLTCLVPTYSVPVFKEKQGKPSYLCRLLFARAPVFGLCFFVPVGPNYLTT